MLVSLPGSEVCAGLNLEPSQPTSEAPFMTPFWIAVAVLAIVLIWIVIVFNGLVRKRNLSNEGWSGIDVQLKRRADLVPQLVDAVRGYAAHERTVLDEVTAMRSRAMQAKDPIERGQAEQELSSALNRLLLVAENYPDLKAAANFLSLQQQLTDLEDQIQMARRYYNGCVRNLNIAIESFPSNLVAKVFGFGQREFFQIEHDADRAVPDASLS